MKILILRTLGTHYHKEGCPMTLNDVGDHYEAIEHKVRQKGLSIGHQYTRIKVEGKWYRPCPACFPPERKARQ